LQAMDQHLEQGGRTVYMTWDLHEVPSTGFDVVVVLLGDEWGRIPAYCHDVLAVFKTFGVQFSLSGNPLRKPSYLNTVSLVRYLRTQVYRTPSLVRYGARETMQQVRSRGAAPCRIHAIPLGYANQRDLPIKPLNERAYDLYFSGSIDNKHYPVWSPQRWLLTPKSVSRRQLVAHMEQLQQDQPDLVVELDITSRFSLRLDGSPERAARRSYSEELMDTKICVVPRGTTAETCRFYEGLRYGCVMITEALPSRWFYDGAPVIQVGDWSELPSLVGQLMSDEALMEKMHQASLAWWHEKCSEEAAGVFMANTLNALSDETPLSEVAASV
ncbi:MAG: glycosyltransferase family 1 protein, partial [Rhodothermaceae bacterium]|nr:glycosyltransferase family 1 protein [Rhodothermaceae bacterium]